MKLLTKSENLLEGLKLLNITTSEELVNYLPYRYEDFSYSDETKLHEKGQIVLFGRLVSNVKSFNNGNLSIIRFTFMSFSSPYLYECVVFNQPYYSKTLSLQDKFTLVGTVEKISGSKININVKKIKVGEIDKNDSLQPVYHLPSQIGHATYLALLKRTFDAVNTEIKTLTPSYLINKYNLLTHIEALDKVHFPKRREDVALGLRTLKFEECLEYCFKNKLIRLQNEQLEKTIDVEIDTNKINDFVKNLPYKLTKDQVTSIREIVLDMKSKKLMYRLLQGDVGTGKTIVAVTSLYANYLRKGQGVLLAPTDSLARQHYDSVKSFFKDYGINVVLLIGSLTQSKKNEIKEQIKSGKADIVVGTHALFSSTVEYKKLSLAIIDEQHRFGVNQRNTLANKGDQVDLLLMSATPIPRTLALSIYGDLDVSSLTMYPTEKHVVKTKVVDYDSEKITSLIDYCLKNNRQVFMVCPKIYYGGNKASSEEVYERYSSIYGDKIALLHGKLKNDEKVSILNDFKSNKTPILVSTTIVELGIDVKTAGGIIIFSANSFGLASLHQLRGRVGRNGEEAYCLLVDHFEENEDASRLMFLESNNNGFDISEEDMKRRGPGDFMGIEQSGFPAFSSLNIISDFKMFEVARNEVATILSSLDNDENKTYYDYCLNKLKEENEELNLID